MDQSTETVIRAYRRGAKSYDSVVNLFGWFGLRFQDWRKEVVGALSLKPGDTVVDVGCGTGLNFPLLQEVIGPEGRIIGVDLTDAMLDQARQRVTEYGWKNVELVQGDAAQFEFPANVDGILSTFALTLVPECGRVIRNGCEALAPGGGWVVLDMRWPASLPMWWRHVLFFLRSYGVTDGTLERRPWEIVWRTMEEHLVDATQKKLWWGFFYLATGKKPTTPR